MSKTITIQFDNDDYAEHFLGWLSDGGGEEDYRDSLEYEFDGTDGLTFDYDGDNIVVKKIDPGT